MANKILHTTIMQKNTSGGKNIIYPKTVTKNIIDGNTTLEHTLDVLKSTDVSSKTTTFVESSTRENLVSGEALATSHGKIKKLISDLKSLAYLDEVSVSNLDLTLTTAYNNRVTMDKVTTSTSITSAGYVADARAVNNLQTQINTVNNNINGVLNSKSIATNVDNIFIGGCYDVNPNTQGTLPEVNGYALLFVRTANTTWIYQDLIYTDTINFKHYHRMNINNRGWTEWGKYTSNSDFKRTIEIRLPYIAYNGKLYATYAFPICLSTIPNIVLNDYDIDGIGKVDSTTIYLTSRDEVVFEFVKNDTNFELGKCYIGRTKFTIS